MAALVLLTVVIDHDNLTPYVLVLAIRIIKVEAERGSASLGLTYVHVIVGGISLRNALR